MTNAFNVIFFAVIAFSVIFTVVVLSYRSGNSISLGTAPQQGKVSCVTVRVNSQEAFDNHQTETDCTQGK